MMNRAQTRLAASGAVLMAVAFAACKNDQLAGPYKQLGPPLLDIALGAAAAPAWPSGTVARTSTANVLTLTLRNLMPLPTGTHYEVALVDSVGGQILPVGGSLVTYKRSSRPVTRDSAVLSTDTSTSPTATGIAAADTNQTFVLTITNGNLSNGPGAGYTHVLVVATSTPLTAGSLATNKRRGFLYAQLPALPVAPATTSSRALTFGSFALTSALRLPFAINGSYDGAFVGNTVRLMFRDLVRPPEGLQYAAWLIDDRTGATSRIGGLLTPVPDDKPLTDADTATNYYLSRDGVTESQVRGAADSTKGISFDNFTRIVLLLEPKGGAAVPAAASAALVVAGGVPGSVASRHATPGKISGTVTRASAPLVNATVYLTGATSSSLLVANTDTAGKFLFRTVNVGSYTINVIPRGQSTVAASQAVKLGTKASNPTLGDSIAVSIAVP